MKKIIAKIIGITPAQITNIACIFDETSHEPVYSITFGDTQTNIKLSEILEYIGNTIIE